MKHVALLSRIHDSLCLLSEIIRSSVRLTPTPFSLAYVKSCFLFVAVSLFKATEWPAEKTLNWIPSTYDISNRIETAAKQFSSGAFQKTGWNDLWQYGSCRKSWRSIGYITSLQWDCKYCSLKIETPWRNQRFLQDVAPSQHELSTSCRQGMERCRHEHHKLLLFNKKATNEQKDRLLM